MNRPGYRSAPAQRRIPPPAPGLSLQVLLASALDHHRHGRLAEAEGLYRRILSIDPRHAGCLHVLGTLAHQVDRQDAAAAWIRKAIAIDDRQAAFHTNLGTVLQAQGKLEQAAACFERALALQPELPEAHMNLGVVLQAQGRLGEAAERFKLALALRPSLAEAHVNLGNILQAQSKLGEAAACYQRALALNPRLPVAHYNLGNTRQAQGDPEAAAASFERALALRPKYAEAHYNLACVLQAQGRLDEALAGYSRAVELQPDYAQARFGQALAQLLDGDYGSGWPNYEARWQSIDHDTPMLPYPQPFWTGQKLETGRLLLWGEQGIGDEIMFVGLIPDALRAGNRILLDCDPRLKPLFARSFPEIEVVSGVDAIENAASAAEAGIAAHLPTGSLPRLFRGSESAFSAAKSPYLIADPVDRACFRDRYGDSGPLIGLAWRTNNKQTGRKRSMDLSLLAPLFALPGLRWISLQYGDFDALEEQAAAANAPLLIDRAVDQLATIDLFAAQVAAMDQVVTIDNSTAHLAGALGLPVCLLLPFAADWRWLEKREDSPWYPTLRLFRQPSPGDWRSVVEKVEHFLL